jgi:hypothetical protein
LSISNKTMEDVGSDCSLSSPMRKRKLAGMLLRKASGGLANDLDTEVCSPEEPTQMPEMRTTIDMIKNATSYKFNPANRGNKTFIGAVAKPRRYLNTEKAELEVALGAGSSPRVINSLLNRLTRDPIVGSFQIQGTVFDLQKSRLLERILPHIRRLECRPSAWTSDGLIYFLQCMQVNSSVEELKLLQLPSNFFATNKNACQALTCMLLVNNSLSAIRISLQQQTTGPFQTNYKGNTDLPIDSSCFNAIGAAFRNPNATPIIQELELVDFFVQASEFSYFLSNPSNPIALGFRRFRISGPTTTISSSKSDRDSMNPNAFSWEHSPVKDITMTGCAIAPESLNGIMSGIAQLQRLKHLTYSAWKHVVRSFGSDYEAIDMTTLVLALLNNGTIESITSMTSFVQTPQVLAALKHNKSLKALRLGSSYFSPEEEAYLVDILEHHNTTLEEVSRVLCGKVKYYCNLNKYGRALIRNEQATTTKDFVDVLSTANDSEEFACEHTKHDALFGLLKEAPNLWFHHQH